MKSPDDFADDSEFRKLLVRRSDVNLTIAALWKSPATRIRGSISATRWNGSPNGAGNSADRWPAPVPTAACSKNWPRCLAGQHGLHGDRNAFDRAESSYVNRVIETGLGIPISLSLVYVAVAQTTGLDLVGVATPMQFLTRYDAMEGPLFLDAFHQGQVIEYDECLSWCQTMTGMEIEQMEPMLEPASPREVIIRMLNNLKSVNVRNKTGPRLACHSAAGSRPCILDAYNTSATSRTWR